MKVAIIHYWLVSMRGGENVLENICKIYPKADIYTNLYLPVNISTTINKHNIYTTFINHLPFSKKLYRYYLPLMPLALLFIKLNKYDLIISSESGPAKGVDISSNTKHICYCHSPMRYLWDMYVEYYEQYNLIEKFGVKLFINYMRKWDIQSSKNMLKCWQIRGTGTWRGMKSVTLQPLVTDHANVPHMEAMDVPFHMGYGSLISFKGLQSDRPKWRWMSVDPR